MAHKKLEDGRTVVDWETGDPEGDRKFLMETYREFIAKVKDIVYDESVAELYKEEMLQNLFEAYEVSTDNQVDDFPRIWIKRPE